MLPNSNDSVIVFSPWNWNKRNTKFAWQLVDTRLSIQTIVWSRLSWKCDGRKCSSAWHLQAGDSYLRRLLVGSAQYTLGRSGRILTFRHWGLTLAERGGKSAKRRAVVGVARKLAVLLDRLWVTGQVYEPLRNTNKLWQALRPRLQGKSRSTSPRSGRLRHESKQFERSVLSKQVAAVLTVSRVSWKDSC